MLTHNDVHGKDYTFILRIFRLGYKINSSDANGWFVWAVGLFRLKSWPFILAFGFWLGVGFFVIGFYTNI